MRKYKIYLLAILIGASAAVVYAQTRGTPSQLRVNIDAVGRLGISSAAQTNPVTQVQFINARLSVDASGNLNVYDSSGAGFAPANATYITQTTNSTLTAEQALASLNTGMLHSATTTGVVDSLADVAIGRFLISQGLVTTPAWAATTDIFILKDASAFDGSVGIGTATPNLAANASANRTLTIFNSTRATLEIANSINSDGGTIGNIIATDSAQSTADKRIAEIRFLQSGTTSNNRGSSITMSTRADAGSAINNPSISIGKEGGVGLGIGESAPTDSAVSLNHGALTYALKLSAANDILRFSGSGGVINMSGGGTWTGSGTLSVTPSTLFDLTIGAFSIETKPLFSATNPTVASGFGTTPTITATNTFAFKIAIGTGGTESTGVVTMPTATTGWQCSISDVTTPTSFNTKTTASTTTSVTAVNYSMTTGLAIAWTAGDVLQFLCGAY
jgi:hypothetical protein